MTTEDAFAALCAKYVELRALRLAHAAGDPSDPGPRLRALAARFPGALRELDSLPLAEIERRVAVLEAGARPPWAHTLVAYHGWMRLALRVRGAYQRDVDPSHVLEWVRANHCPSAGDPPLEVLDEAIVAGVLRPPGGRLTDWALAQIAFARGVSIETVRAEAFHTGKE